MGFLRAFTSLSLPLLVLLLALVPIFQVSLSLGYTKFGFVAAAELMACDIVVDKFYLNRI